MRAESRRKLRVAGALAAATILAACNGGTSTPTIQSGGTVALAEPNGWVQNWIFPIISSTALGNWTTLQSWLPLYWFGDNGKAQFNPTISMAEPPAYSDGGQTVTIKLKSYKWSDGTPVTSRDIEFWVNLLTAAEKNDPTSWLGYSPSGFPFNTTSISYPSDSTIQITFGKAYNQQWLLYNELAQLYPIPQHAWDKTSATGSIGNTDRTPDGALAVAQYLIGESKNLATYSTNPLWQVVDGPFRLQTYQNSNGNEVFVPNTSYSGPDKPHLASYSLLTFASPDSEVASLLDGKIDYGFLPLSSLSLEDTLKGKGYTFAPWTDFGVAWMPINFTNPKTGPIFKQLYIRQAMQHLIDQDGFIKNAFHNYAVPTYGPIPTAVANPFVDSFETKNPYPFSVDQAKTLLTSHGWSLNPNGVTTCTNAGDGSDQCGTGIANGAQLSFSLIYASANASLSQEVQGMKSDFSQAGIQLDLQEQPIGNLYSDLTPCDPKSGNGCSWDMLNYGGGWTYNAPFFIPTGDAIFETGAGSNGNGYSDSQADSLIAATLTQNNGNSAMQQYQDYLAQQLPYLWTPWAVFQISVIRSNLHGVAPQDPYLQIYPQNWYYTQ